MQHLMSLTYGNSVAEEFMPAIQNQKNKSDPDEGYFHC